MDIEEDIKKLKELNNLLKFFKTHGWIPNLSRNTNINETIEAIEHLLKEIEEDKNRINKLEKENKEILNSKIGIDLSYDDYIPKQKVIDKINYYDARIKHAKQIRDKEQEEFYIDIKRGFYKLLEDK